MEYWITISVGSSEDNAGNAFGASIVASSTIESKLAILVVLNLSRVN